MCAEPRAIDVTSPRGRAASIIVQPLRDQTKVLNTRYGEQKELRMKGALSPGLGMRGKQ